MCWSKTQKYNMKNNFSISEQINALRNIDANIPKNELTHIIISQQCTKINSKLTKP